MTRLTFSLLAFAAIVFLSASSVLAQGISIIRDDHKNYTKSFTLGNEPDLSPNGYDTWRRKYTNHRWNDYAKGGEFREPVFEAQTLMGVYLLSHVDHQVAKQIDDIIVSTAAFGPLLSERMTLELIGSYLDNTGTGTSTAGSASPSGGSMSSPGGMGGLGGGTGGGSASGGSTGSTGSMGGSANNAGGAGGFYSDLEIQRMQILNRDLDVTLRKRLVSGVNISNARMGEIRSIRNLFQTHKKDWDSKDWESIYYHLRERFNLLNDLAAYFPFNSDSDAEKREEILNILENDEKFKKMIQREVEEEEENARQAGPMGMGMGMGPGPYGGMGMTPYGGSPMGMSPSPYGGTGMSPYGGSPMGMSPSPYGGTGMSPYGGSPMGMSPPMGIASPAGGLDGGAGLDDGGMPAGLSEEELKALRQEQLQAQIDKLTPNKADDLVALVEERYKAFKYIVGVYQSSGYYLEDLQTIHRYYLDAANAGDPVAQYHLALFLMHLGDIVDPFEYPPDSGTHISAGMDWLNKARASDTSKVRVAKLEALSAEVTNKQERRQEEYKKKFLALVKVEEDKIDIFEKVLSGIRERIGTANAANAAEAQRDRDSRRRVQEAMAGVIILGRKAEYDNAPQGGLIKKP